MYGTIDHVWFRYIYCYDLLTSIFSGGRRYYNDGQSLRNVTINHILAFVTGSGHVPLIGYAMHPTIKFIQHQYGVPTASTCTNTLYIPLPQSLSEPLRKEEEYFDMFDNCFTQEYFGQI